VFQHLPSASGQFCSTLIPFKQDYAKSLILLAITFRSVLLKVNWLKPVRFLVFEYCIYQVHNFVTWPEQELILIEQSVAAMFYLSSWFTAGAYTS